MRVTLQRTFLYMSRSRSLTIASISSIVVMFLITGLFVMMGWVSNVTLRHYEQKAQITTFFKDDATEEQILAVKSRLEQTGMTKSVRYISKEDALKIYVERFNEDPRLLESIAKNILPASLEIQASSIENLQPITDQLSADPIIEDVDYSKEIITKLQTLTSGLRIGILALTGSLVFSSIFMVLTTMGLVLYNRRDEIEIMSLVGATRWQIRAPFILMGMLMGIMSGILSGVILGAFMPQMMPIVSQTLLFGELSNWDLFNWQVFAYLTGGLTALGAFMGAVGAYMATTVYLRRR